MSVPVNPLDRFRSYAYHHILVAANSTESIRAMMDSDGESLKGLKLGEKAPGGYVVVCDTRKNSYFSITEVSYTSTISAGNSRYSNLIYGTINMNIVDSTGVTLLNYLKWIEDESLKVSLHKTVFVLKTIFVGHTYEGTTETVYQDAIPMMMFDMSMSPSHRGSTYYAKFAPIGNGAVVYIDDYSRIFDIPGVKTKTNLLKDAIKSLETELNAKSRKWYKDLQVKIIKDAESKDIQPSKGYGKLVQYMFTVPDNWAEFKVDGIYHGATETKFKSDGTKENVETKGVYIGLNTTPNTTILDALETMLKQCNDVQKLAGNDKRAEGNLKGYKILTNVTSDDDTVVVHYDIANYAIPKLTEDSGKKEGKDSVDKSVPFQIDKDKNLMTFEYLFTGKNVDILNFDMKINNVNVFLADNLIIGDQAAQETTKNQADKPADDTKTKNKELIVNIREKDPIILPMKTGSQQQNMAWSTETDARKDTVKSRQQFIHNMSLAHGVSSFNIILKIRGNPNLYRRFSEASLMPHVKIIDNIQDVKYITSDEKFVKGTNGEFLSSNDVKTYLDAKNARVKEVGAEVEAQQNKTATLLPFYVKVHIRGQDFDVLQGADSFSNFKPFQDMWYNGYYLVTKIEHKFMNGEFYQELMLSAIPLDLYGQEQSDKNKVDQAKQDKDAKSETKPSNNASEAPDNIAPLGMP